MSDPHPLQAGDRSQDLSDYSSSTEADRRQQNYHGDSSAGSQDRPASGRLFKAGSAMPTQMAPFSVLYTEGDAGIAPAETYEIDTCRYGDSYDPTAPARVRIVAPQQDSWHLDSDRDGQLN